MGSEGEQPTERVAPPPATYRIGDDDVIVRDYRPGDEAQIVDGYTRTFGGFYPVDKPVDQQAFVRWFTEPYDSHQARIVVAEIDGRIVAASGALSRETKVGDSIQYGTAGGVGTVTLPEYQGRRIQFYIDAWDRRRSDGR